MTYRSTRPYPHFVLCVAVLATVACRPARHDRPDSTPSVMASPAEERLLRRPSNRARHLVLGRIVDLDTMQATTTVTDSSPDQELTDPAGDFGVVLSREQTITAFRLSTGASLWRKVPDAPCRSLALVGSRMYAACGNKLLSYGRADGSLVVVDPGPGVVQVASGRSVVATLRETGSLSENGRVTVFDGATNKRLASRVLPELGRSMHNMLIASPSIDGICVLGLRASGRPSPTYKAGCYDPALSSLWTRTIVADTSSGVVYDVRQDGPYHLVLDDQSDPLSSGKAVGKGRGVILRWRDGEIGSFSDRTFATIEDRDGERILDPLVLDVFRGSGFKAEQEQDTIREAKVAADQKRAFALIRNGASVLAGIDLASHKVLFLTPLRLGDVWGLEIADGYPIVRTDFNAQRRVTIHDPSTGAVLYEDARPFGRSDAR